MTLNEYQMLAMRYRLPAADEIYAVLGLPGEVGELSGYLAKARRDGFELDDEYIKKELGDILWFIAAIADDAGFNLKDIAATNLNKLESRKARNTISGHGDNR